MFKGPLTPDPANPNEKIPSYVFDYAIKTDGISISTRFVKINSDPSPKRVTGKQRFAKKSKNSDSKNEESDDKESR